MSPSKVRTATDTSWTTATNPLLASLCMEGIAKRNFLGEFNKENNSTVIIFTPLIHNLSKVAVSLLSKIDKFKSLQDNWDSYGAIPPNSIILEKAKQYIRLLDNLNMPLYFIAPGPNGEVMIELKNNTRSAEIEYESNGSFSARFYENNEYKGEAVDENLALVALQSFIANDGRS